MIGTRGKVLAQRMKHRERGGREEVAFLHTAVQKGLIRECEQDLQEEHSRCWPPGEPLSSVFCEQQRGGERGMRVSRSWGRGGTRGPYQGRGGETAPWTGPTGGFRASSDGT